ELIPDHRRRGVAALFDRALQTIRENVGARQQHDQSEAAAAEKHQTLTQGQPGRKKSLRHKDPLQNARCSTMEMPKASGFQRSQLEISIVASAGGTRVA